MSQQPPYNRSQGDQQVPPYHQQQHQGRYDSPTVPNYFPPQQSSQGNTQLGQRQRLPYYNQSPPPPFTKPQPPRYSGWFLLTLIILFLVAIGMIIIEIAVTSGTPSHADTSSSSGVGILGTVATVMLLALHVLVMVRDGHNFFTLFGTIRWQQLKGWLKVVLVFVYLSGIIMPGIYLVTTLQTFLKVRRQTVGQALYTGWLSYRSKSKNMQRVIGIVGAILLLSFILLTTFAAMADRTNAFTQPTATAIPQQAASTIASTATDTPILNAVATDQPTTQPTRKPAPSPMSLPTPRPVPTKSKPIPTPLPPVAISFTCAQAVDYSYGKVCVHAAPGAALTITVTYCSGYDATSASLQGTHYASSSGNYEWDWTPETKCRGIATANVSASWNGQSTYNSDNFTVQ